MLHDIAFLLTPDAKKPWLDHAELPELEPDHPLAIPWGVYRREVARFLAEGREGQCVLIHNEDIVGFWSSHDEAYDAGRQKFGLNLFLLHRIRSQERLLRVGCLMRSARRQNHAA